MRTREGSGSGCYGGTVGRDESRPYICRRSRSASAIRTRIGCRGAIHNARTRWKGSGAPALVVHADSRVLALPAIGITVAVGEIVTEHRHTAVWGAGGGLDRGGAQRLEELLLGLGGRDGCEAQGQTHDG